MHDRLRIGVVGAGAVIERYHMPAISAVPEVVRTIVVDADGEHARRIADRYNFPLSSSDLSDLVKNCDAAVVAVPNGQHAAVSCELLAKGVHVLCEKPMARNRDECIRMIEASRRGRAQLCIGHNRRFRQHVELAKKLLDRGFIGEVTKIEAEEGSPSDWPRSQAYFDPALSGGGALLDTGIHSIDLIRWLVGEFEDVEYEGNGTEEWVESEAELRFHLSSGASGKITVSRTRTLLQRLTITGTEGALEIGLWEPRLGVRCRKGKAFENFERLDVAVSRRPPLDPSFVDQLRNFVGAVRGEGHLLVDGAEGMSAVEVVSRAYRGDASTPLIRARASGERR
ncbi:MAG: Gfo/Idh/MocA family protein [Candidatus Acidiferrales bacterium]